MISVIVPIYNLENCVRYCIDSVLGQSFCDFELILVNDGSNDNTLQIIAEYAKKDNRVQIINKKNGGLSSARNAGIEIAKGEYILFLDGDDYYHPMTLEILNRIKTDNSNPDFIQFAYNEVTDYNFPFAEDLYIQTDFITDKYQMFHRLHILGGVGASACTKLIKTELAKEIGFKEGIIHEDEHFTTRLITKSTEVIYTNTCLYQYVVRKNSIIHQPFSKKKLDSIMVIEDRIRILKEYGFSNLVKINYERLLINCILLYYAAKNSDFKLEAKFLKDKVSEISKIKELNISGINKIIYKYPNMLPLLHIIKKIKRCKMSKIKIKLRTYIHQRLLRLKLKRTDFSIISNNCWGGFVYQMFGLKYTSPTIGLFIMDDDYIKFLENLQFYLSQQLRFIDISKSKYKSQLSSDRKYPVGILHDIEIHFLHYVSEREAIQKWKKRKNRINFDNLIIKMSQRSHYDVEILERFRKLPYTKKICFTEIEYLTDDCFVYVPELKQLNIQGGDETEYTLKQINIINFLNNNELLVTHLQ